MNCIVYFDGFLLLFGCFIVLSMLGMIVCNFYCQLVCIGLMVIGVLVGVMVVVVFNMIVCGFKGLFEKVIKIVDVDMMVYQKDVVVDILSVLDEEEICGELLVDLGVVEVVVGFFVVKLVEMMFFMLLFGIYCDEFICGSVEIIQGEWFEEFDEVVFGLIIVCKFNKGLGDMFNILGVLYIICGVFCIDIVFFNSVVVMLML